MLGWHCVTDTTTEQYSTYLGIQSVAKLTDTACDLVKVDRLFLAAAFHYKHGHGCLVRCGWNCFVGINVYESNK